MSRKNTEVWSEETNRSLISMDVTSKDKINFIFTEPALKHNSHGFPFHKMSIIRVVDWGMHQDNKPRSLLSVNFSQLLLKPPPLRSILNCHYRKR